MSSALVNHTPREAAVLPANEHVAHEPGVQTPPEHAQHYRPPLPADRAARGLSEESSDVAAAVKDAHSDDIEEKGFAQEPVVTGHDKPAAPEEPPSYDIGEPVHRPNVVLAQIGHFFHTRYFIILRDFAMIGLLLGIWIPSVVRKEHRHKWVITTIISWFFIALILLHNSKYIPQRPFVRLITYTWQTFVERPWFKFPYYARLAFGWLCLFALYFGTAFGIKATPDAPYRPRGIAIFGIFVNYAVLFALSKNWRAVRASTTIIGLGMQMILGLLVYKTGAGYNLFGWISTALADLLEQGQVGGATFFWDKQMVSHGYFFINTLSSILWFVAFATMMFYIGAFGWAIKKFAWLFYKLFGVSGAEAVVAAASPFIGQGENCVLTRPFVPEFTESEFHQVLTSGFATISGSVFIAYVNLGMQGRDLVLSSMMSIPGSIAASKVLVPETQRPMTLGRVVLTRGSSQDGDDDSVPDDERSANALHALSNGAAFGVRVVWLIWANVLCILSLVYMINGILSWIGEFWGLRRGGEYELTLYLIFGYILYPYVWLIGVQGNDLIKVSRLLAHKIVANEFVAYKALHDALQQDPAYLSPHNLRICTLALCGFANLASMGISIGVMSAMAPKRADAIIRLTPTALLTGAAVTCMTAAIGGMINK